MPEILEPTQYLAQVRAEVNNNLGTDATETDIVLVAALVTTFLLLLTIMIFVRKQASAKADRLQEQAQQEQKRQEAIQQAIQAREQSLKQSRPSLPAEPNTKLAATVAVPQIKAVSSTLTITPQFAAHVPQDSMLRRHYISHVRAMLSAINSPQPSDSMLRRHYEQFITSQLERCLTDYAEMEKLEVSRSYRSFKNNAL